MGSASQRPELIAIVGPTASGKSDLAMKIAEEFDGEIISADSRTVYKGMDIGTAKASRSDQKLVKHWGLDLVEPGERFTAHQFKNYAVDKIKNIQKRNKLPLLVGGTGLYVDSVLFDFEFRKDVDLKLRAELESKEVGQLQRLITKQGLEMPRNDKNKRHLIRTIETDGKMAQKRPKPPKNSIIIGIMPAPEVLKARINKRAAEIFDSGVAKETKKLLDEYSEAALASTGGIVYKICLQLINGEISTPKAVALFKAADWQFARRQRTWFKRNKFIQWYPSAEVAYESVAKILNKQVA